MNRNYDKVDLKKSDTDTESVEKPSELQSVIFNLERKNVLLRETWVNLYEILVRYDRNYRDLNDICPYEVECCDEVDNLSIREQMQEALENNERYSEKIATITNLLGNII